MFEEYIAQGRSITLRLQGHVYLTPAELEKLPASKQVTVKEAESWSEAVQARIRTTVGLDGLARYKFSTDLYQDELDRGVGNALSRAINLFQRRVDYLVELQKRLSER